MGTYPKVPPLPRYMQTRSRAKLTQTDKRNHPATYCYKMSVQVKHSCANDKQSELDFTKISLPLIVLRHKTRQVHVPYIIEWMASLNLFCLFYITHTFKNRCISVTYNGITHTHTTHTLHKAISFLY